MGDLQSAVIEILKNAMHGKNKAPAWVSAYQVLNRLPEVLRSELVRDNGGYGGRANDADRGTGAANAVMRVLRDLGSTRVAIDYLDAYHDASFAVGEGTWVQPGNVTCAIYKWVGPRA